MTITKEAFLERRRSGIGGTEPASRQTTKKK